MNASDFLDLHSSLSQAHARVGVVRAMGERMSVHAEVQAKVRLAQTALRDALETMAGLQREERRQMALGEPLQTTGRY